MSLSKVDATYDLTIELGIPIDMVVFESDVGVELINIDKERFNLTFNRPDLLVRFSYLLFLYLKPHTFFLPRSFSRMGNNYSPTSHSDNLTKSD